MSLTPEITVFVQNESGSYLKHYHDEKTLEPTGFTTVSRPYPFPYGFVVGTTGADGLNVDCFVLTDARLKTGTIMACTVVGLMEQTEDHKRDHNILAVPAGQSYDCDAAFQQILTDFVEHVFDHIGGKCVRAGRFLDAPAALDYISAHSD